MMETGVKLNSRTMLKLHKRKFLLYNIYKSQICYTTGLWTLGEIVQYNMMHKSFINSKITEKAIMLMEIHILMSYI